MMKKFAVKLPSPQKLATILSTALCAVLFISANSTSCHMIHEPKAPAGLERFSKVK